MSQPPTFQDVEAFVRTFAGLRQQQVVAPDTRLEADLGITGDDGDELLQEASRHFGVQLAHPVFGYRPAFCLAEDEHLFHGEGFDLLGIGTFVRWLRKKPRPRVRDLTVAELQNAILRLKRTDAPPDTSLEHTRVE
ncbi:MAG: DUF1493 family protein [Burkholderiales bacterium]|nr:DUF1493 family protein [Burkholderiales bacterium]